MSITPADFRFRRHSPLPARRFASLLAIVCLPVLAGGASAAEPVVPAGVEFNRDLEFSNPGNQHLQLNLALPKAEGGLRPAVICIHGGGFRQGRRENYDGVCLELASRGYVAATITYRLAPDHPFPAAVEDCKAAVRWLRAHAAEYRVDPERIAAWGGSAGANLALLLGTTAGVKQFERGPNLEQSSAVACVVSFSGPSDLTRSYGSSVDAGVVLPLYFGGDLSAKRREHIIGSPLYWVTPEAAPILAIHGTADPYVAYEQSFWIVDRLLAAGVEAGLLTIEEAGHGFKGADAKRALETAIVFLDQKMKK
ncbi:MAG: alpha/beta hydrolase [Bryobacterales bacterium]|nr:alpha/beta hydrolase [Opitutaceae bacterium]MCZ2155983.1 alpha/beta hydrolase [Bryobacterales bacterium]